MDRKTHIEGLIMGALAYLIWGLLPLYWKLVHALNAYQLFSQRVIWSLLFVVILLLLTKKWGDFKKLLKEKGKYKLILGSSFFISINWLVYIWAVNNGYVLESSLGYFMNPLVLTLFGHFFFKEKLTTLQKVGMGFALAGVLAKTVLYGRIPYIGITLAISFAAYGVMKKKAQVDSMTGLAFETLIIGIPALFYITFVETSGVGITGNLPGSFWFLIALSGIATATPLILYAEGAKKLPLSTLGFLQYIAPTITLFLGIYVFGETFDYRSFAAFGLIWVGLVIFSYSQILLLKKTKNAEVSNS